MTFEIAERKAVPLMIGIAGTSGSGKTYSALLMAAGLAGKDGKVGFIDTELGRGAMYADDVDIKAAMPGEKYFIKEINEPFTPAKYSAAIREAISSGVTVLVIDSVTHEWEGFGGCCDIAENNKLNGMPNWAKAKMEHKKLMNVVTQSPMDIIFCLRAREKAKPVKVVDENGRSKIEIVHEGMQPIQEKNFMFEMTVSMMMDAKDPGKPSIEKCPKPLRHLFDHSDAIVNKNIGEKLKDWANGGAGIDLEARNAMSEFKEAAGFGSDILQATYDRIKRENKSLLARVWTPEFSDEVKALAKESDRINAESPEEDESKLKFS